MAKKLFIVMIFIGILLSVDIVFSSQVDNGPKDIFELIVSSVCDNSLSDKAIFVSPHILPRGTSIKTAKGQLFTLKSDAWFVFIDDFPGANWSHACRYVLVDGHTGKITIIKGSLPPENLIRMIRFCGPDPFASKMRKNTGVTSHYRHMSRTPDKLWAVIISGGGSPGSNHPRYWNDCSEIYKTLVNVYGYPDEQIIVIMADGLDPSADQSNGQNSDPDLDGDGDDDIMYACTKSNLETIFYDLSQSMESMDTLFVFATDHGDGQSTAGHPTNMVLWNSGILWDYEFAALLEPIDCREILITLEPCFSGGFVNDVIDMNSNVPRVISTAANDHEYSWAMPPDYLYDTYVFHWTAAVRGVDAWGSAVDADTNNDGEVTMDEAYQYALVMDTDDEHPQYGEWPAGYGASVTLAGSGPSPEGEVMLDQDFFSCDDTITITVEDLDLLGQGTLQVTIESTTETTSESVTLTETDEAHFSGSIQISVGTVSSDGILQISPGDQVVVRYYDASHGKAPPQEMIALASIDCDSPEISNIAITNVTYRSATISWQTNEIANSVVEYGLTPDSTTVVRDDTLSMNHSMTLYGLSACSNYYFKISAHDIVSNVTVDNNGGYWYFFRTHLVLLALEEPMDTNPGWSCEGDWAWGTPTGDGYDPASGYNGPNVYGYNLAGLYSNGMQVNYLTTPGLDCSAFPSVYLSFHRWLGVESATFDHATVQVSHDGTSWQTLWENSATMQDDSWVYQEFDISPYAAGYSNVQIRWSMGPTDGSVTYSGWNIDDVRIFGELPCTNAVPTLSHAVMGCIVLILSMVFYFSVRRNRRKIGP